ncbi:22967_t:CDS:2, partial [Racocetra persica]
MVDETIRDRSLYDPQALEYFFKILTDVSQDNNPDGDDEREDNIEEERETELEVLLQKLIAECEAVARIGGAEKTYPVGPYCEEVGVKEVKEEKEIEVEKEEAGVEKAEEKEVEVKREEKKETKEEKSEKYEENVLARIRKIKEDVEELTKKSKDLDYACESWIKKVERFRSRKCAEDGDLKEQFDP